MSRETASVWRWLGLRLYLGPMASVKQIQVTFDCAEPERVACFLVRGVGVRRTAATGGMCYLGPISDRGRRRASGFSVRRTTSSGAGPRLFFQRVPEGKVVKNRLHLDVRVGTGLVGEERLAALEAECARLVVLGVARGRLLHADGENESCLVMQDIEGNEFCLD